MATAVPVATENQDGVKKPPGGGCWHKGVPDPSEHFIDDLPFSEGNSCNYISVSGVDEKERKNRSYFLLGLLNSAVFDWYFRIENSNNHVGNYEIDIDNNREALDT